MIYNPPSKPLRPFEADYPRGASSDGTGRLAHDIDGNPLYAEYIVGRNRVGEKDVAFPASELDALGTKTTGRKPNDTSLGHGTLGQTMFEDGGPGPAAAIHLSVGLDQEVREKVLAHELGHVVDVLSGSPSLRGLHGELEHNYSTLATGVEGRPLTLPEHFGYSAEQAPYELMAEGVRAYLQDPNYFKTVAPKSAKAIRTAVNAHPTLSKTIQFNSGGGMTAATGAAAADGADGRNEDPAQLSEIRRFLLQALASPGA